jgi:putative ABC transport system permease protein
VPEVYQVLGGTADPENPSDAAVSRPSDALTAQLAVRNASGSLILGLGAIALVVGVIGIANIMIISVLERRTEIGLRRALGAARVHVAAQFLTESLALSILGGGAGIAAGVLVTGVLARTRDWAVLIPAQALWGSAVVAVLAGTVAGLYPALRAAGIPPTDALRTT